jgi:lysophospholipase L1-like esterase
MSIVKRRIWKGMLYGLYLVATIAILLEIALRIYNPLHFRIKGDHIILPISQQQVIRNTINPKLDSVIINTRNGLGFRGSEIPAHFDDFLSIITVGGSTTECHFLSDTKTWPYLLDQNLERSFKNVWLNNAGLEGHSTFGNQVLLNDYLVKIRPKIILFYVGINDVENAQPTFHDKLNTKGAYADFKHFIFTNSEVLNLALNISRGWRAQKMTNTTNAMLDLKKGKHFIMNDQQIAERIRQQERYLITYQKRVEQLIDTSIRHNIFPLFMTQPLLVGIGKDGVTGVDLETLEQLDNMNGKCLWKGLGMYNKAMKEICSKKEVPVIDLAMLLPKNSIYYYDSYHYTNEGAKKIAEIVNTQLTDILASRFPRWRK